MIHEHVERLLPIGMFEAQSITASMFSLKLSCWGIVFGLCIHLLNLFNGIKNAYTLARDLTDARTPSFLLLSL